MFDSDNILIWELFVCNDINRNWHVSYQTAVFQNSVDDGWTLISFLGILNLIHIRLGYWPYNELKHGTAIIRFVVLGHNNFPPSVILGNLCYILIIDQSRFSVMLTFHMPHCFMGLSPDTQNCWLRMRRECRERFPCYCGLAIPICITARAWRTCRDACRDRWLAVSLKSVAGKTFPAFPAHTHLTVLRIWQEANVCDSYFVQRISLFGIWALLFMVLYIFCRDFLENPPMTGGFP